MVAAGFVSFCIFQHLHDYVHEDLAWVLIVSLLHSFNCNVVYTQDLPKIVCALFILYASRSCLSHVLWMSCLVLHDLHTDDPGRQRKVLLGPMDSLHMAPPSSESMSF